MLNRIVLWNPYAFNLIFAPVYATAKARFKALLKPNVLYAEDMNQHEVIDYLSIIDLGDEKDYEFFESDLSKQDRQTDEISLTFEYWLYELLGVNVQVNNFYKKQHDKTVLKAKGLKVRTDPKRHTGQTTVGFGNLINNFRTYAKFFSEHEYKLIMGLGDDLLALVLKGFNEKKLQKYVEQFHNMESTYSTNDKTGIFCQFIFAKLNDTITMVPNIVRLEDRYRSIHKVTPDIRDHLLTKTISYCWMLNSNADTNYICKLLGVNQPWGNKYSLRTMITANAMYHNAHEMDILRIYENLIHNMKMQSINIVEFTIISNKNVDQKVYEY